MTLDQEVLTLIGGVANSRYFEEAALADTTIARFLKEIDEDMPIEDLDRDGLLLTIFELEEDGSDAGGTPQADEE